MDRHGDGEILGTEDIVHGMAVIIILGMVATTVVIMDILDPIIIYLQDHLDQTIWDLMGIPTIAIETTIPTEDLDLRPRIVFLHNSRTEWEL